LSRITEDLLLLARGDEDQLTVRAEPVDLRALLARSADAARPRAAAAGLRCRVTVPAGLTAQADPDRIRQAIDNLVDNAIRFAPPGSEIEVSAAAAGADVSVTVADAGPGFPPDYLPRAFERFARPEPGQARGQGAGLGLAIVAAIARAHGGSAVAANRPDGGAVVTLTLPRAGAAGRRDGQFRGGGPDD
jgi:signal transduction histidine kinase